MKLSNLSNKAKLAMAAGVGVLVVGTGVGLYATQFSSPKNVFLSRLQERTSVGKLTQDYEVALKTSGTADTSKIDGISINGQSTTDGKNAELTVNIGGLDRFGINVDEMHFVLYENIIYINASVFFDFMTSRFGTDAKVAKDEYIALYDLVETITSSDTYSYEVKSPNELSKEVSAAVGNYLKSLDDKKFLKEKDTDYVTLKLEEIEIKELFKTILETLANSKNYMGDKEAIKDTLKTFDEDFDKAAKSVDLSVTISEGKGKGDSKTEFSYTSDEYGSGSVTVTTDGKDYQSPEKPKKVIERKQLEDKIQSIYGY